MSCCPDGDLAATVPALADAVRSILGTVSAVRGELEALEDHLSDLVGTFGEVEGFGSWSAEDTRLLKALRSARLVDSPGPVPGVD